MKSDQSQRFKEIRSQLNLTQVELAEKIKVSQGTITDIERGRIGVSKRVAKKMTEIFGIDSGVFYGNNSLENNEKSQGDNSGVSQGVPWSVWANEAKHHVNIEYVRRLRKDLKEENPAVSTIVENYLLLANFQDFIQDFIPEYLSDVRRVMIGRVDPNSKDIGYTEFKKQSIESLKKYSVLKEHLQKITAAIVRFYHDFEPYDERNVIENHYDTSEKA